MHGSYKKLPCRSIAASHSLSSPGPSQPCTHRIVPATAHQSSLASYYGSWQGATGSMKNAYPALPEKAQQTASLCASGAQPPAALRSLPPASRTIGFGFS